MTPSCLLYMLTHAQGRSQNCNPTAAELLFSRQQDSSQQLAFNTLSSSPPLGSAGIPIAPLRLPAALLAQYPSLSGIWDSFPLNDPEEGEDNISGRSSFESRDLESRTFNQTTKSSETLSAEEKIHLLENIIRTKGMLTARIIESALLTVRYRI
jgi:hypothetical protein